MQNGNGINRNCAMSSTTQHTDEEIASKSTVSSSNLTMALEVFVWLRKARLAVESRISTRDAVRWPSNFN